MGKPLKDTKFGKLLFSSVGKGLIKSIPFVGDIAGNIMDENNTVSGSVDKKELPVQLARMAIMAVLIYLAVTGTISFDDAENAKELLTE